MCVVTAPSQVEKPQPHALTKSLREGWIYHIHDLEVIIGTGESLLLEVKAIENLLKAELVAKWPFLNRMVPRFTKLSSTDSLHSM